MNIIILYKSITLFYGTNNISHIIPHIILHVQIKYETIWKDFIEYCYESK